MQYAINIPSLITRKEKKITASGLISRHFSPTAQHAHCDRNTGDQHRRKHYAANTLTHLGGKRPHLRIRYPHQNRPTLSLMKAALPATLSLDPNWGFRRSTAKLDRERWLNKHGPQREGDTVKNNPLNRIYPGRAIPRFYQKFPTETAHNPRL